MVFRLRRQTNSPCRRVHEYFSVMSSEATPEIPRPGTPPDAVKAGGPRVIAAAALRIVRSAATFARHLPDRVLHHQRRERARDVVRQVRQPRSVVFLCHGNVCRSPFAAAVFTHLAQQSPHISAMASSAGFIGPGRQSPIEARDAAVRRSYELESHRSQLATAAILRGADLIVVMSADQARAAYLAGGAPRAPIVLLGDFDPRPIDRRTILDPWGKSTAVFDASYDRIERCVRELVTALDAG
jgi:protein-tyrosine-phosphatase